jgi:hypothetical protein
MSQYGKQIIELDIKVISLYDSPQCANLIQYGSEQLDPLKLQFIHKLVPYDEFVMAPVQSNDNSINYKVSSFFPFFLQ